MDGLSYRIIQFDSLYDLIHKIHDYSQLGFNKDKPLHEIMEDMGISDTITFIDERIVKLIELYKYYNSNATPPAPFDSQIWYDTVVTLEVYTPKLRL